MSTFTLPELKFERDALEPYIDEETVNIHHDKHHQTYVDKLNAALENHSELQNKSLEALLADLNDIPEDIRTAVRNNGGGHYNHSLYWETLIPGGSKEPAGGLKKAIDEELNGFDAFKQQFSNAAAGQFGSGWAWLVVDRENKLKVSSTPNQDNPLTDGDTPILGIDVWEHAYYLKYQNRRPEYIKNFFNLINWDVVSANYDRAKK